MQHISKMSLSSFLDTLAITVLCCLIVSCQGNLLTYKGSRVTPGESISLLEGEHSGYWQTRDLRINYTYSKKGNQMQISGDIDFAGWLGYNFQNILYFNISMFLVDDQETILQSSGVTSSSNFAQSQDSMSFSKTLDLPPGTTAIAFGYTGEARGIGDEEAGTTSFFYIPVHR